MNTLNPIDQDIPTSAKPRVRDFEWEGKPISSAPDVDQVLPQTPQAGTKTGGGEPSPGPWYPVRNTAGTWEVKIANGMYAQSVATVSTGCPEYFRGDPEANARLLAAAPRLLEALALVVAIADRKTVEFDAARAAIAEATGKDAA